MSRSVVRFPRQPLTLQLSSPSTVFSCRLTRFHTTDQNRSSKSQTSNRTTARLSTASSTSPPSSSSSSNSPAGSNLSNILERVTRDLGIAPEQASTSSSRRAPTNTPNKVEPIGSDFLSKLVNDITIRQAQPATQSTSRFRKEPHHLHLMTSRHNTHVCLTRPNKETIISISSGNLGFRNSQRGSYEASFQTAAHVMRAIFDRGMLDDRNADKYISSLELNLRGFGDGRRAFLQALLGIEGKSIRPRIVKICDSTRLKFGGTRSPNPKRLG